MRESLGLGGDGDEIEVVEAVERAFAVRFDQSDADRWITVGDLFASLLERRSLSMGDGHDLWLEFVRVLGEGVALDAGEVGRIGQGTRLLALPLGMAGLFRSK